MSRVRIALIQFYLLKSFARFCILKINMKRFKFLPVCFFLLNGISILTSQEALKSAEEEYFDFLSLQGIVKRPTLGFRTLSDSEWKFQDEEILVENEDGTFSKIFQGGEASEKNVWAKNNLGSKWTLWESKSQNTNWFLQGIDRSVKLKVYGPEWYNSYNTASPYGQNDGALWQGKGYNTSLTGGARLEALGFEVTLKPQISFSQNLEFEFLSGVNGSEYSYFVNGIDLVQRYGDSPFFTFDWGDTEIRWTWHTFTVGFGTQAPWLGPAWLNPMLGSNNAATYPKVDIGIRKQQVILPWLHWYIGDIEARTWVGMLQESEYFTDSNNENKNNLLTGLSVSFTPVFIPGLTIGANRIFIARWQAKNIQYLGRLFTKGLYKNDVDGDGEDQKASLFAYWTYPKVGFEVYGELGFDDFSSDYDANPFHTAIYTVGVKQSIPLDIHRLIPAIPDFNLKSEFIFEWNNFEMSQDFQLQWKYGGYYTHGKIAQGYTNKGQILGAGSGYMGNSQYLQYTIYYSRGSVSFIFHRSCPNNNYVYNQSVGESDIYPSELYNTWYAQFETYRSIGGNVKHYITDNLLVGLGFYGIGIFNPQYKKEPYLVTMHINATCKYIF